MLYLIILILAVNVLVGILRGGPRALVRLITLVAVAGVSLVLTRLLADTVIGFALDMIPDMTEMLNSFGAGEILGSSLDLEEILGNLIGMIASPLLFLLLYLVLKPISLIIYKILCKIFFVKKAHGLVSRVLFGAAMGLLAGVVGVLVFLTSLYSYYDVVDASVRAGGNDKGIAGFVEEQVKNAGPAVPGEVSNSVSVSLMDVHDIPVLSQMYDYVGEPCFKFLTTRKAYEKEIDLKSECLVVAKFVKDGKSVLATNMAAYGEKESAVMGEIAEDISGSYFLSELGSGIVNTAAKAWANNQAYMGMPSPAASGDESAGLILHAFFEVLSTTNPDTISADISTFADVFGLLVKHNLFAASGGTENPNQFAQQLASSGFVGEARTVLARNERMQPVDTAMSDAAMRVLLRETVPEGGQVNDLVDTHPEMMDTMANALKGSVNPDTNELDKTVIAQGMKDAIAKEADKGVQVDDSVVELIADGVASSFTAEELSTMTNEQIKDRLLEHFTAADGSIKLPA